MTFRFSRRAFLRGLGTAVLTRKASAQSRDVYEYGGMFSAGYADPMTVDSTGDLRIWVQSGQHYSFRIARLSLASSPVLRDAPVFEGPVNTADSTDSDRRVWKSYATFATAGWPKGLYVVDIGPEGALSQSNASVASAIFIVRRNGAA